MLFPRRTPEYLITTSDLTGGTVPIHGTTGQWYAVYALELSPFIKEGDILDVSFTLHVTDDAFRPSDPNVTTWGVVLDLSTDTGDDISGRVERLIPSSPSLSPAGIDDDAHHALCVARTLHRRGATVKGTHYLKLSAWFRNGNANGTQNMTCPDNGFGIQCLWYRS